MKINGDLIASQTLLKNNSLAYIPFDDYNPSTKKYVDDYISSLTNSINSKQKNLGMEIYGSNVDLPNGIYLVVGTTWTTVGDKEYIGIASKIASLTLYEIHRGNAAPRAYVSENKILWESNYYGAAYYTKIIKLS